ncbi:MULTISPECIES: SDR family NAD(P)-dependent oxidoreductase [Pseudomonas]|uniref:Short chain dehydrogenase n=2 Tax=Pseudomonas TaxID=286 RepID=A0AAE6V2Z8_9PSED|nr:MULTISPECIES: SDR family NAD(P)-dependent oxidoreductase [Pseudomonas]MDH4846220.1 SDR family oxidoreductase [Pseudomonas sp. BN605]MDH4858509.1 SDR family oxidoreductase [Pseudomonas sp. BN505]NWL08011.1 oxidoreductase [Pseudomonas hunanensis]NWL45110.1 oxidoreductase [Pseudomonas hunanensis]QHB28733.1 short chain dehydrogenase [Pseudomonas monteilii]
MNGNFQGKAGIITGAAGGIGSATARRLSAEGAQLLLVDRNEVALKTLVDEIRALGGECDFAVADVSEDASVQAYVAQASNTFDRIDFFFNNAGIEGPMCSVLTFQEADFDKVIAVNLKGVFLGMRYVLPIMVKQGFGSIVNTGSIASARGLAGSIAYTAAKHAVLGMVRTGAADLAGTNVRLNCVMPGMVDTPMLRKIIHETFDGDLNKGLKGMGSVSPMHRVAQPEEIAAGVVFLLSDDASFINGVALPIDGGTLATIPYNG